MELAQKSYSSMGKEEEDGAELNVSIFALAVVSGVVMILVSVISCVCCFRKNRGRFNSYSDSRRDTVPLEDLLSKPSLADPESVFSEASYDGHLSMHTGSWLGMSGEVSSIYQDSVSFSGPNPETRDAAGFNQSLKLNNTSEGQKNIQNFKKWNSQSQKNIRSLRQIRAQERENQLAKRHSETYSAVKPQNDQTETEQTKPFVHFKSENRSGDEKVKFTLDVSPGVNTEAGVKGKAGMEPSELKVHRSLGTPENRSYLSSTRCSFSHEVGHVAHGNKVPRTSLPRNEEGDENDDDSSSQQDEPEISLGSTDITCQVTTEQTKTSCLSTVTISSGTTVGQPAVPSDKAMLKNDNYGQAKDSICYEKSTDATYDTAKCEKQETQTNNCDVSGSSASEANRQPNITHVTEDVEGNGQERVVMRRSLSCQRRSDACSDQHGNSRKKTISLNLKIDFHFNEEPIPGQPVSTVICSNVAECSRPNKMPAQNTVCFGSTDDNTPANVKNMNKSPYKVEVEDKEKLLERLFAEKSAAMNICSTLGMRKRRSEPTIIESNEFDLDSSMKEINKRFSMIDPPTIKNLALQQKAENVPSALELNSSHLNAKDTNITAKEREGYVPEETVTDTDVKEDSQCHTSAADNAQDIASSCNEEDKKESSSSIHTVGGNDVKSDKVQTGQNACLDVKPAENVKKNIAKDAKNDAVASTNAGSEGNLVKDESNLKPEQNVLARKSKGSMEKQTTAIVSVESSNTDSNKTDVCCKNTKVSSVVTAGNDLAQDSTETKGFSDSLGPKERTKNVILARNEPDVTPDAKEEKSSDINKKSQRAETERQHNEDETEGKEVATSTSPRAPQPKQRKFSAPAAIESSAKKEAELSIGKTDASLDTNRRQFQSNRNFHATMPFDRFPKHGKRMAVFVSSAELDLDHVNKQGISSEMNLKQTAAEKKQMIDKAKDHTSLSKKKAPPVAPRRGNVEKKSAVAQNPAGNRNVNDFPVEVNERCAGNALQKTEEGNNKIPVIYVDDDDDDDDNETGSADISGYSFEMRKEGTAQGASYKKTNEGNTSDSSEEKTEDTASTTATVEVSDDSDYDNPWDDLDDAVKRASIRYNRRPSRIAAGADTKTLLLKSAEDLGRLLEEADRKRQLRQVTARSSCQVISPDGNMENMTIPFTRFSPHRHTVKGIMTEPQLTSSQSTDDILKTHNIATFPKLSLLKSEAKEDHDRGIDSRRPKSLTSKMRAKISSPESKKRKK